MLFHKISRIELQLLVQIYDINECDFQVILSTNIAESSITLVDVRHGLYYIVYTLSVNIIIPNERIFKVYIYQI